MRAHTGGFDRINLHGMELTGSFMVLPPSMCLLSSSLISGSSLGELRA